MIVEHRGTAPSVHPDAWVAPNAVLSGDVHVGAGARVLYGAVLTAEDGRIDVGEHCIVMEQAVLRGARRHPCSIGRHTLIGPHAHVSGATVGERVFIATQASLFNGCKVGDDAIVRIGAIGLANVCTREEFALSVVGDEGRRKREFDRTRALAVGNQVEIEEVLDRSRPHFRADAGRQVEGFAV